MHIRGSSLYFTVVGLSQTTAVLAAVQPWGQCGGMGYNGDTACADGWGCKKFNDWYSQCLQGQGGDSAPTVAPVPSEPVQTSEAPIGTGIAPVPSANVTAPVPTTLQTLIASSSAVAEAASSVVVVSTSAAAPTSAPVSFANGEQCSLDALFKAKGKKYFGTATDQGALSRGDNAAIIKADFGQVTPENRYAHTVCEQDVQVL